VKAKGDYIVTLDADLQDRPEEYISCWIWLKTEWKWSVGGERIGKINHGWLSSHGYLIDHGIFL